MAVSKEIGRFPRFPAQCLKTSDNFCDMHVYIYKKKDKRKIQGVPQSQTAAFPRHQEEEETDKTKQAQIEQTYEKH